MNPDVVVFRWINIDMGWDFLAPFMHTVSNLRIFIPLIVLLVVWMVWRDGVRGRTTILALVVLIAASDQLSSHAIKPLVHRTRPCRPEAGIVGVKTHGAGCSGRGSFPSSHAVNIAAAAVLLGRRYRRAFWFALLFAFLVGYSRIYLGVHYPLDVAGGWGLGAGLGWLAAWTAGRAEKRWVERRQRLTKA